MRQTYRNDGTGHFTASSQLLQSGGMTIDLDDFDVLVMCLAKSSGHLAAECEPCDLDGDQDLDCADWVLFRQAWTEPQSPPELAPCGAAIPATSEWGLALMTLVLITLGTLVLRTQRGRARSFRLPDT